MNATLQGVLSVLGRLFLVTIFVMSAVGNKIPNFGKVVTVMEGAGVPQPEIALRLAIAFLLVGGLTVLVGWQARFGSLLLAVFLVLATYYFHAFWKLEGTEAEMQMIQFMKNLGLFGAMLFVMGNGAGAWSVEEWLKSRGQRQAQRQSA
ncbi:MAG: DoxX family protein [Gemmataceae bacterium]